MSIILFDNINRRDLYPFTYNKAVSELRMGIFTGRERWEKLTGADVFVATEKYLQELYAPAGGGVHTWIDAAVIVTDELVDKVKGLQQGEALVDANGLIAVRCDAAGFAEKKNTFIGAGSSSGKNYKRLEYPWQIMQWNEDLIRYDFGIVANGGISASVPAGVNVAAPENIFIEEGAKLNFCNLNATGGPIYIGKNAEIMEGSSIRGPFVLGGNAVVKMNSRIYGATTLGPFCVAGGEIKNSVIMGYSNKAHDGYLGDSVVGEWCNFGAGSTNSNVKNTAGDIKMWSFAKKEYVAVGNKCGVMMGDYSRVAVNTPINTGAMIGISCNVYGAGLSPTVIDNFTWGPQGGGSYEFEKAINAIANWMQMKKHTLDAETKKVLASLYRLKTGKHDSFV